MERFCMDKRIVFGLAFGILFFIVKIADAGLLGCNYIECQKGKLEKCEKYRFPKLGIRLETAYTEYYKGEDGCTRSLCCFNGSPEIQTYRRGPGCLATKCVSSDIGDPCQSFDLKKGDKPMGIELEATYNETCNLPNGKEGAMSVCCQPGHPERFLTVGYAAEKDEFPHHVRLNVGCGGTIYNDQWIITAAHCLTGDGKPVNASSVRVWLGTNIVTNKKNFYKVAEIVVHKNYSHLAENQKIGDNLFRIKSDIALVKLDKKIQFSESVKALPIAPMDFDPTEFAKEGIIIGWGKADNYQTPPLLRKSFVPVRPAKVCEKIWGNPPFRFYSEQAVCIGGIVKMDDGSSSHGVVAGQGDSGGPAICKDKDGFAVLCGITSYGSSDERCQRDKDEKGCLPSIYSSVSHFRSWIEEHAGSQEGVEIHKVQFSGQPVQEEEGSHQLIIAAGNDERRCGGTLIKKDAVVTAAHCVYKLDEAGKPHRRENLKVIIPNTNESFKVASIYTKKWKKNFRINNKLALFSSPFRKSNFKILDDFYYDYDIAVLKLDGEIENAKLVKLPPRDFDPTGEKIEVTETAWKDNMMKNRKVHVLPRETCQHRFSALNIRVSETPDFSSAEWTASKETNENTTKPSPLADSFEDSEGDNEDSNFIDMDNWNDLLDEMPFREYNHVEFFPKTSNKSETRILNTPGSHINSSATVVSTTDIMQWVRDLKNFEVSPRELCYVEDYSGGSTCDRILGGGIICKDQKGKEYLCGVQTFRLCFGSFPNIMVDVKQFRNEIQKIVK